VVLDIPETFNYLLGLKVKKIKSKESKGKNTFLYLVKKRKNTAIVWHEYNDN